MPRVFICYRREDSAGHAGRLYDHLQRSFAGDIFMDVVGIDGGIEFEKHIESVVGSCDVLLAIIGQKWLSSRLSEPKDLLRGEIQAALDSGKRVIPVLVDDARFPAGGLPDDLAPLGHRQTMELRNSHWNADVQELIEVLKRIPRPTPSPVHEPKPAPAPVPVPEPTSRRLVWATLAAVCAAVLLGVLLYPRQVPQQPAGEPTPEPTAGATESPVVPLPVPPTTTATAPPTASPSLPTLACLERWSQPQAAGVACGAGEMLAGGGCACPGGTIRSSYPSPEGADGGEATAWQCDGQCPGGLKAVALCCTAAP